MCSEKEDLVQVLVKLLLTTLLAKERDLDLILTNRKELAENLKVEGNLERQIMEQNPRDIGWKGPLENIWSNLQLEVGLLPTLDQVSHGIV